MPPDVTPPDTLLALVSEFLKWSSEATAAAGDDDLVPGDWVAVNADTGGMGLCREATEALYTWLQRHGIEAYPDGIRKVHVWFVPSGAYYTAAVAYTPRKVREAVTRCFATQYKQALSEASPTGGDHHVFALVCTAPDTWWAVDLTARQYDSDLPFPYYWRVEFGT